METPEDREKAKQLRQSAIGRNLTCNAENVQKCIGSLAAMSKAILDTPVKMNTRATAPATRINLLYNSHPLPMLDDKGEPRTDATFWPLGCIIQKHKANAHEVAKALVDGVNTNKFFVDLGNITLEETLLADKLQEYYVKRSSDTTSSIENKISVYVRDLSAKKPSTGQAGRPSICPEFI